MTDYYKVVCHLNLLLFYFMDIPKLMGILASPISTGFQLLGRFVPNTMNIYKLTVFLPIEENEVKNSSLESLF
jgi:hypothetical protein